MSLASEIPPMYKPPRLRSGLRRRLETRAIRFEMQAIQKRGWRFRRAVRTLARTGIIVIRGAATQQVVSRLAEIVDNTWVQVSSLPAGRSLPGAIVNRDDLRVIRGYKALVESKESVINFRHGEDDGMMDVFHPENLVPECRELLLQCLHEDLVCDLAQAAFRQPLAVTCRNLYVNRGVSNTRFFHCDGEHVKVKSFVYLGDVSALEVGPYCYIKHSHRNRSLRLRNQAFNDKHGLNKHEYRLLDGHACLPIFCRAGDMVVSAQHGVHRGYPQTPSAERAVLVNVFERSKAKT